MYQHLLAHGGIVSEPKYPVIFSFTAIHGGIIFERST